MGVLSSEGVVMSVQPDHVAPVVIVTLFVVGCAAAVFLLGGWPPQGGRHGSVARSVLAVLAALCVGAAVACLRVGADQATGWLVSHDSLARWELELLGDPTPGERGWSCLGRLRGPGAQTANVWVSAPEELAAFDRLRVVGRFSPNAQDDWGARSARQGVIGRVRVVRILERNEASGPLGRVMGWRRDALARIDPASSDGRALLAATVLGFEPGMAARSLRELFSRAGVAHLVAVSGGHLVILSALMSAPLRRSRLRPKARVGVLTVALGCFVVACGLPLSALRSWAMATVACAGELAGRRSHGLSSLSIVGSAMLLADPGLSGQLGFLLSLCSVAALCVFSPLATHLARRALAGPRRRLEASRSRSVRVASGLVRGGGEILTATLVCQLATLPLTLPAFGELSLVAPVANLMLSLPFSLLVAAGCCAALTCSLPVLGSATLWAAELCARLCLMPLRLLCALPWASLVIPEGLALPPAVCALAAALLWWRWDDVRPTLVARLAAGALALVLSLAIVPFVLSPAEVCVLDVGQGDAILVRDGPHAILVDTGPDASCSRELARLGVLRLDAVVLTHLHADHVNGLRDLAPPLGCGSVVVARGVDDLPADVVASSRRITGRRPRQMSEKDTLKAGAFTLTMIWPTAPVDGKDNEDSIELVVSYEGPAGCMTALLTGDAERDETRRAVRGARLRDIDVLKVGHHGSEASIDPETARILSPDVAVASAGENNKFNHPTRACRETLEGARALFLCTKDQGTIRLRPNARGVVVVSARDGALDGTDVA
ncbi:hypothetical protein HMPREF2826_07000 [Olsenella sp. HMSC062G07]|nr:hypothetical protein HMPREF2826_07000 [Olsenella sp. HMSC062G07]